MKQGCECFSWVDTTYRFVVALKQNHINCMKQCLTSMTPAECQSALINAIRDSRSLDGAKMLLFEQKTSPNFCFNGQTALSYAVNIRRPDCVKLLLEAKATVLHDVCWDAALSMNNDAVLQLLLDAGLKPGAAVDRLYFPSRWCRSVTWTMLRILRKRVRIPSPAFPCGGYPLPLGLVQQIAAMVWSTRRNAQTWSL